MTATQMDLLAPPAPRKALTHHQALVLAALLRGERLSQLQALRDFGIGRLAARVEELRRMQYRISTEWGVSESGARYAIYRMAR